MKLSQVASILGVTLIGHDADVQSFSIDTRTLQKGDLFIALRGPHFDAHDYVEEAIAKGAGGIILHKPLQTKLPFIQVQDTHYALMALALYQRSQIHRPVIAITGSCGKTTTRMLLENILSQNAEILASPSSFNNDIGIPLTLLRWRPEYRYAVLEMGANHPGEIARLTQLVKPNVDVITNAGAAHLEGFGDIEGVVRAKGEIFQGLLPEGVAVLNQDDSHVDRWRQWVGIHRTVTFGIQNTAEVMAKHIDLDHETKPNFTLQWPRQSLSVKLPLIGAHNVNNALAAAAVGYALGISLERVKVGLESAVPVYRRLVEHRDSRGATIIDDSYNANPSSVEAAIRVLACRPGQRILVLGDMLELGDSSNDWHRHIGQVAQQLGIHQLYCYGNHSRHAARAFGKQGYHFSDQTLLSRALQQSLHHNSTVLVKGSLGMKMNHVVLSLLKE